MRFFGYLEKVGEGEITRGEGYLDRKEAPKIIFSFFPFFNVKILFI